MEIKQITSGDSKGSFLATDNDDKAGEMFYTWAGDDRIIIDHTEVEQNFRGQGVGHKLLLATVEFARNKGINIIPLCPFAKSVFDKEPELRDVL